MTNVAEMQAASAFRANPQSGSMPSHCYVLHKNQIPPAERVVWWRPLEGAVTTLFILFKPIIQPKMKAN